MCHQQYLSGQQFHIDRCVSMCECEVGLYECAVGGCGCVS